jgi:hypothetical protein
MAYSGPLTVSLTHVDVPHDKAIEDKLWKQVLRIYMDAVEKMGNDKDKEREETEAG